MRDCSHNQLWWQPKYYQNGKYAHHLFVIHCTCFVILNIYNNNITRRRWFSVHISYEIFVLFSSVHFYFSVYKSVWYASKRCPMHRYKQVSSMFVTHSSCQHERIGDLFMNGVDPCNQNSRQQQNKAVDTLCMRFENVIWTEYVFYPIPAETFEL